jgi:hypothetical protein
VYTNGSAANPLDLLVVGVAGLDALGQCSIGVDQLNDRELNPGVGRERDRPVELGGELTWESVRS